MDRVRCVIDLRSWCQFLAVAESLHFGRAALALHMTQPPLTQGIQKMESLLGVRLFERTRRSVSLTREGRELVEPARELLRRARELEDLAQKASRGEIGTVRLGFVSTVGFGSFPEWVRRFRQRVPRARFVLREATTDVQLRLLSKKKIDAGFVLHAPERAPKTVDSFCRMELGEEPLVLAASDREPWVHARRLNMEVVLSRPLVIFPRKTAPSVFDSIIAYYHVRKVAPRIAQQAIQMQTIINLVSAGVGIALVPEVVSHLQRPGVVYRCLPKTAGAEGLRVQTSLVWSTESSSIVERFVEHIRDIHTNVAYRRSRQYHD